jgi:hypothetical protein
LTRERPSTVVAVVVVVAAVALLLAVGAPADAAPPAPERDADRVADARRLFSTGTQLVREARWHEALTAFAASYARVRHPVTLYNVGACERALGHYTRARDAFARALASGSDPDDGGPPPAALAGELRALLAELDGLLVRAAVTLEPPDARVAVDGRPLTPDPAAPGRLWAGLAEPGPGAPLPAARVELVLDPGLHLVTLQRPGYADAVVRIAFAPGERRPLRLALDLLPARLSIVSNRPRTVVTVDDVDVGVAPLELSRPPGRYRIALRGAGLVPYRTEVTLAPGQELTLRGTLADVRPSILRRWWFWTAAGVVVTGVALGAYFGARAAETPRVDGGGLGWAVSLR